jgi:polyhydroxyalkanoate synthesis regulator phasin
MRRIERLPARFAWALLVVGLVAAPHALAGRWQRGEAEPPAAPANSEDTAVGNTVAELQRLMNNRELTELRTTYNGNYGASLLFHADSMNYYVALFHEKEFWRVIRTDSVENAETLYVTFADQTKQLAQVYLDTVRLQAGKAYSEKLVALNERRLRGLQQEVEQQRQQSMQVSNAIQERKQQAVALSSDLRATNTQLETLDKQIKALQAQQINPELSLPPAPVAAPAAAAAATSVAELPAQH